MAVLALTTSLPDMRERLGNMVIGNSKAGAAPLSYTPWVLKQLQNSPWHPGTAIEQTHVGRSESNGPISPLAWSTYHSSRPAAAGHVQHAFHACQCAVARGLQCNGVVKPVLSWRRGPGNSG